MDNFLSTKFILTVLVLVLSYVLVQTGKLEVKQWLDMALWFISVYVVGNTVSKFAP